MAQVVKPSDNPVKVREFETRHLFVVFPFYVFLFVFSFFFSTWEVVPSVCILFFWQHTTVIRSGLDSLGLVSLTSEALRSAMTWLAVHKTTSQLSEQILTSDGMMHSGFESSKGVPRNVE